MSGPDYAPFYASVRQTLFGGHLTQGQVDGMGRILAFCDAQRCPDRRWRAYMLATPFHETGATMQPVEEVGCGAGRPYADGGWWGRGLVQLTWEANYQRWAKVLDVDLLGDPDLAMTWPVAMPILYLGMTQGLFTGVGLGRYFGPRVDDPLNARRIINGTDRAALVAGYHRAFLAALP